MKGIIRQRGTSFQVRYWDAESGREIAKTFNNFNDAEMFKAHLNVSRRHGKLDARDYARDNPLGFRVQAEKWLEIKSHKVRDVKHIKRHIKTAIAFFGDRNIKDIGFGEIEDFLDSLTGLKGKTVHNYRTTLHSFFEWFNKREKGRGYVLPDFPTVDFELGWRKIVDKPTQTAILDEIHRITYHINPRIWFGISLLANFPKVRPAELISILEGDIDRHTGEVWIRRTKEGKEKRIYLLEEDLEFLRAQPEGFGRLPFFRHLKARKGIHKSYTLRSNGQFGPRYLYKWWRQACSNLGIEGVDLYGGTKHSTVTAARKVMTPEEIRRYVTEHQTNVAFDRYLQVDADTQREASARIRSVQVLSSKNGQSRLGKVRKL